MTASGLPAAWGVPTPSVLSVGFTSSASISPVSFTERALECLLVSLLEYSLFLLGIFCSGGLFDPHEMVPPREWICRFWKTILRT